jgi:hypothetical protein
MRVEAITPTAANNFVKAWHYSHKVVPNSQLHLGIIYKGRLSGVMQFGPSINKKGTINLVRNTKWNGFTELNRYVCLEDMPKNTESRALAIGLRLIKKFAPHIDWVITFADATQCGSGTIYRASGFLLIAVTANTALRINPATGQPLHIIQAHHLRISKQFSKWEPMPGYQIKYVKFLKEERRKDLTVEPLPYSILDTIAFPSKVRHVKKCVGSVISSTAADQATRGGASPTPTLHFINSPVKATRDFMGVNTGSQIGVLS